MRVLVDCDLCGSLFVYRPGEALTDNQALKLYRKLSDRGSFKRVVLDKDGAILAACPCVHNKLVARPSM